MKRTLEWLFPALGLSVLGYIWAVTVNANGGVAATFAQTGDVVVYNTIRLTGLTAFVLVAFQVITGAFMPFWEKLYGKNFYKFHAFQGIAALAIGFLHPLLLLVYLRIIKEGFLAYTQAQPFQYFFGSYAGAIMLVTVSTAILWVFLRKRQFQRSWRTIHLANYAVFFLSFFHSLAMGTDVGVLGSPLRPIWWTFFVFALGGVAYRSFRSTISAATPVRKPGKEGEI